MRARGFLALLVFGALGASACDVFTSVGPKSCDQSPEDNKPARYSDGTVTNGVYMSSPWTGPLLYFPGGMQIRIEHHLGAKPTTWSAFLSFDEFGTKNSTVAEAAGNQVEASYIDDQVIIVKNTTCSDSWLLVTAQASAGPTPPT